MLASFQRMAQTHSRRDAAAAENIHAEVEVDDPDLMIRLTGPGAGQLDVLETEFEITAGVRGNTIHLRGPKEQVENAERALMEILKTLEKAPKSFSDRDVERSIKALKQNPETRIGDIASDVVLGTPRKTIVAKGPIPKTMSWTRICST